MNNKSKNDLIKTNVQGTYENEVGEIIMKRLFEEIKRLAARKEASVMAAIVEDMVRCPGEPEPGC